MSFFDLAAALLVLTALFSYLNHKLLRLPSTIGLMALTLAASLVVVAAGQAVPAIDLQAREFVHRIDLNETLLHGMLGFLLFAGALHINLSDLAREKLAITVLATFVTLFLFVALMVVAYRSPSYLAEPTPPDAEPTLDPATKLNDVRTRNRAILDGNPATGTRMSMKAATAELLGKLKTEKDTIPFPMPEPAQPPAPEPKKK